MVKEAGKGMVLVVSKWDAADDKDAYTRDLLAPQIAHNFAFVPLGAVNFYQQPDGSKRSKKYLI